MRVWTLRAVLSGLVLVASPAAAGPPFLTDDPEPADYQHFEINVAGIGIQPANGTPIFLPFVDANYGAAPNLQLHVGVGLATAEEAGGSTAIGYGDTELGLKYRFIQQEEGSWLPDVALYPNLEIPTGSETRGLGTGHVSFLLPIWIEKDWGEWSSYGGGGYWFNHGATDRDYWFLGWLLSRKVTEELMLGGELFHETAQTVDGRPLTGFNLGGSYDVTENGRILFSAGRGLQNASTEDRYSWFLGYQFDF